MSKEAMKLALEDVYQTIIQWDEGGGKRSRRELARRIVALAEQPAQQQEPAGWRPATFHRANLTFNPGLPDEQTVKFWELQGVEIEYCYTSPPAQRTWVGLTDREVELIDGMIEVQLHHANQCDRMANRVMADKQKGWDMERVELLRKLKENT